MVGGLGGVEQAANTNTAAATIREGRRMIVRAENKISFDFRECCAIAPCTMSWAYCIMRE
ncbi:hypothetical protein GCM10027182_19370 [Aquaspirillum soli]